MRRKAVKRVGTISVQVKPQILKTLELFAKAGESKAFLINEALRQYFIQKEFDEIRDSFAPYAKAKGILTDEDAFSVCH